LKIASGLISRRIL